jgi:hypothetical protein
VVRVAEGVTGLDLPERVELVRAALADADRARFEQELDQALDTAHQPGTCGRSATWSRPGIEWCSPVGTVVRGGQQSRRGCAAAKSQSGDRSA